MAGLTIGSHISSAGGYEAMGKRAVKMNANTFAFFTRNPRGGKAKEIQQEDVERYKEISRQHEFGKIVAHAPYTMNACAAKEDLREFAKNILTDDLKRMDYIPGNYYNFHPGSHVGQGVQTGIEKIAQVLNAVLKPEWNTTVLLETMAGKGTEVGGNFEEIRQIMDLVECREKLGVCMDTCHLWDGGYDIVGGLDGVVEEFDRVIGLEHLKAVHLNDSKNPLGSHKDRHEKIGEGHIGLDALAAVVQHPKLRHLPFILETPNDEAGWAEEIRTLRDICGNDF
ncbi:MAG: deoxyribonuclease IV [Lachnospiraceae bacterium]|jgi:deoxyribonuclease-4|nr:deoxyribonuclease IV [Lachnospiraceae bacterium]MCI9099921.1 deoxyribonuclease IV [Lachnospiraceae bacterium]